MAGAQPCWRWCCAGADHYPAARAGVAPALITIPLHALVLRRRPQDLGLLPEGAATDAAATQHTTITERSVSARSALREAGFWWLTFAFAVCLFVIVALTVHLIPYLVEHGHSPTFAATVAGLFGLMTLAGRLTIGPLGDRYPRRWVTAGLIGLQVAGCAGPRPDCGRCAGLRAIVRRRVRDVDDHASGAAGRALWTRALRLE